MAYTTRIAPSPTGDMHIGTLRTAYFNWLAARACGGRFVVRIDDTDAARNGESHVRAIFDALDWLGLDHDLAVRQSDRRGIHLDAAKRLVAAGKAEVAENGAIVLTSIDLPDVWNDSVCGDIAIPPKSKPDHVVLVRGDGSPTYHFASVVDDIDLGIDFVIRGQDHVTNTVRHIAIYNALEAPLPRFAHVGLIHKDGKKMSKRDGAAGIAQYRDAGYDPDAVLNFLARMGWGPTRDDKSAAILDKSRMLDLFLDGGRMKASPAGFDQQKLDWYDRKYKAAKAKAA